jgi:hypothetical protein
VTSVLKRKATCENEDLRKEKKRRVFKNVVRNIENGEKSQKDILIMDSGGGRNATVTSKAWHVLHRTSHKTAMSGYQDKAPPKVCPIVNAATKATILGRESPVIFIINYATLVEDSQERESLCVPFDMMRHGIKMDLTPRKFGGEGGMRVEEEFFPFNFDDEKLFFEIERPTPEDMETYDWYELTSPYPFLNEVRRNKKEVLETDIPISEWRKRFAMLPEDVVQKTLLATTQYYMSTEAETRQDPRRHLKSRTPGIRSRRQNEAVSSDTFFPSVTTDRGNTCSQIFVGADSDRWEVYPLKSESQNGVALQDYTRQVGAPTSIKTDNAQSEVGATWTSHCREQCIANLTTEPHSPWQNPAENRIGSLGAMVRNTMRQFKVPLKKHDWVQKWCCEVHNHVANRRNGWRTPIEASEGHTPDISKFRFYPWEPIWYYDPKVKQPKDNLKKARWLGFATSAGDELTYYIQTEKDKGEGRNEVLIRSIIRTRRKNVGIETEYVNDDPEYADFFLSELEDSENGVISDFTTDEKTDQIRGEEEVQLSIAESDPGEIIAGEINAETRRDLQESLPPEVQGVDHIDNDDEIEQLYDQFQMEDDDDYEIDKIVDHVFKDGILILKVRYQGATMGEHVIEVPFGVLKKDVPLELAKYVRDHVLDEKRNGHYNQWAKKTIQTHGRCVRRLYRSYNIDKAVRVNRTRRATKNRTSKNARNAKIQDRVKYDIRVPRNTREALLLDKQNKNTKWADAIAKEMTALNRLDVFEYKSPAHVCNKSDGWQFAPMHMIFDIKQQDLRHKARLVCGGHVIDSSGHVTYSSTIKDISVRLLMIIATQNKLDMMVGDIGNAFPTAPCAEKIWTKAGPEFGDRAGSTIILKRALYGLKTASRSFHEFFGDCLRSMGFQPSRADQDLWLRKSDDYDGYDYIATHVDDIIIAAKRPGIYMAKIEQEFLVRNKEDSPTYYLGSNIKKVGNYLHVSSSKYVKETLKTYQEKYGAIKKENIPLATTVNPELDDSEFLCGNDISHYQHIIGTGQWLIVAGRFDLTFAISSLSRFSAAPRKGHLDLARKVFGYLRKYPRRGYVINPEPPKIEAPYDEVQLPQDFGGQYHYFKEDLDPRFPEPLLDELDVNIFCDADHAHDKVTGRSVTGILGLIGSTPTIWSSKRQASVQTSTFGAEFTALKKATEDAVTLRYHLRSMGVKVTKETVIWVDNLGVVLNASNPGSTLNKKNIALAYHFVREHVAGKVISIRKIDTKDNYADPMTKALNSTNHHDFFYELQRN